MANEKQVKPKPAWERLETRPTGDETPDALYSAVGKAMSAWNEVELGLSYLFGVFINASGGLEVAGRAFGAVATTSGKLDMLGAAADVFIGKEEEAIKRKRDNIPATESVVAKPEEKIFELAIPGFKDDFKSHLNKIWKGFGERRNDIAHGAVLQHGSGGFAANRQAYPVWLDEIQVRCHDLRHVVGRRGLLRLEILVEHADFPRDAALSHLLQDEVEHHPGVFPAGERHVDVLEIVEDNVETTHRCCLDVRRDGDHANVSFRAR